MVVLATFVAMDFCFLATKPRGSAWACLCIGGRIDNIPRSYANGSDRSKRDGRRTDRLTPLVQASKRDGESICCSAACAAFCWGDRLQPPVSIATIHSEAKPTSRNSMQWLTSCGAEPSAFPARPFTPCRYVPINRSGRHDIALRMRRCVLRPVQWS